MISIKLSTYNLSDSQLYFNKILNYILNSNESNININNVLVNYLDNTPITYNNFSEWKIDICSLNNNDIDNLKNLIKMRLNYYFNNRFINYMNSE